MPPRGGDRRRASCTAGSHPFDSTARVSEGYTVLVETSGAIDMAPVDRRAHVILDVKCPGSGMTDRMHWPNLDRLSTKDEAKFVLADRADYEWARDMLVQHALPARCAVLFSPVFGPSICVNWPNGFWRIGLPSGFRFSCTNYLDAGHAGRVMTQSIPCSSRKRLESHLTECIYLTEE